MIKLVIHFARLCVGILTLVTQLLGLLVELAVIAVDRCSSSTWPNRRPEPTARHNAASPSRRRAFTAPPRRARRSAR